MGVCEAGRDATPPTFVGMTLVSEPSEVNELTGFSFACDCCFDLLVLCTSS